MTEAKKKWSEEAVAKLTSIVGSESPVSAAKVAEAAVALEVSERSVASKLRQLKIEVASLAKEREATFTPAEGEQLQAFVESNSGSYTYKELAEQFGSGKFTAKQLQGKLLALELTQHVKPAEKVEVARTYTPEEEGKFVAMANAGKFLEEIAEALGKPLNSVRGKALSLTRSGSLTAIPKQKESHANTTVDPVEALGDKITSMTVADIAKAVDKTERGIKTTLTRRGIKVADYDGAAKKAKAEATKAAAA